MSARVLVVDDVLPNVKLLAAKLTREYFNVITAFNGPDALELVHKESPDIVLLDVMMPGMDGFEVCEKIRSDPATMHIPVVMVTALSDVADRVRGLEAGADDFLTKPVNDIALFARVRSLVRLKMMMDEWRLRETTSGQFGVIERSGTLLSESFERAQVLVLEDSVLDLDKVLETLQRDHNSVMAADSCAKALERALSNELDLVVISLTLLNEDGLRLCSQLRSHERTRQVPILLMVDEGDLNHVAKGLELGANDYVIKPIDRNELLARARTQIRRKRYQERLRSNYEQSLSMALTDSLTGVFNRRYVNAHLPRLLERAIDSHKPVSVLMFDIDHFKVVNDSYGHAIGDEVLREVSARSSRNLRTFDLIARLGGEEFIVILPDTDGEAALIVAERLRQRIADTPFTVSTDVGEIRVTVSIGISVGGRLGDTAEGLIRRSDEALYEAKRSGRNCVIADARVNIEG
ncbi:PleD family two-component system response regulator [Azospirillum doebereinerae]|uniref:diguanylate cyclase n=1 Tax=Azospirillum doebereinerae TaxID=92933 RepID=A0A3S0XKM6_9PROT|nr:PleD family two-component system response regulator [Azospirillum doebereinerae]MCG5239783.1 PleD family two-component system response regulator [Azospirillum doebereinerae]RUQ67171.1 PleD family two-component system response regulator [Azospirillum doebereinerae]